MNYHLHRQGRDVEVVTLDDLRRRRETGELDGKELVWREGMPDWQWLDSVLDTDAKNLPRLTPPPLPGRNRTPQLVAMVVIGIAVVAFIARIAWVTPRFVRSWKRVQQGVKAAQSGSSIDVELAKQPAVTTNKMTEADAAKRARDFRMRQYLDGYLSRGQRNPACDSDAQELIKGWIALNFGGADATNSSSPRELADKLAANPECTDPVVLTVAAVNSGTQTEKVRRLERALKGFENSNHRSYVKLYAAVTLATELAEQPDRRAAFDGTALQYLENSFVDGSFEVEDQPEIAEILINGRAEPVRAAISIGIRDHSTPQPEAFPGVGFHLSASNCVRAAS